MVVVAEGRGNGVQAEGEGPVIRQRRTRAVVHAQDEDTGRYGDAVRRAAQDEARRE